MQLNQEIRTPNVPDEIHMVGKPGTRQEGFKPTPGIPIKDLTPDQIREYAELWKETFFKHYCKAAGYEAMPEPDYAESPNQMLINVSPEPLNSLPAFQANLKITQLHLIDVLDNMDALASEPIVDDERRKLISIARMQVLKANEKIESAYEGL